MAKYQHLDPILVHDTAVHTQRKVSQGVRNEVASLVGVPHVHAQTHTRYMYDQRC